MPEPIKFNSDFEIKHNINAPNANIHMPVMMAVTDHYEIGYTVTGDRLVVTPTEKFEMHSGFVGTSPLGMYHQTFPLSNTTYEGILIKYSVKIAERIKNDIGEKAFADFYDKKTHSFTPKDSAIVHNLFKEMLNEYNNASHYANIKLQNMLSLLIIFIMEHENNNRPTGLSENENTFIYKAKLYIANNFASDPTPEKAASSIGYSKDYFCKMFKQKTGETYASYLKKAKMEQAKIYLYTSDISIADITDQLGFRSESYFCSCFKEYYGVTPLKFRKEAKLDVR